MKSVMAHQFSQVPKAEIQRSSFDRSSGLKTAFDAGYLVPIFVDEALPGDTYNLRMTAFARLATPIKPVMDNMYMETFWFAIPYRLVWENWARFNGEQQDPGDSTDFLVPQVTAPAGGYTENSLEDYMGLPTKVDPLTNSAFAQRAYNLVYNEWFRDENLQQSQPVSRDDGPDDPSEYTLMRRGKRHDYFTSALPWPQKDNGNPVTIPLGDKADIVTDTDDNFEIGIYSLAGSEFRGMYTQGGPTDRVLLDGNTALEANAMYADLSEATAATINQLRQAFQIQRLFERDARGGSRLTEIIKSHFGVTSPDSRLQRPEFLGSGSSPVNISPIAQTSDQISGGPGGETPQGNLAGIGTSVLNNHGFTKSFTEHCVILGIVNVRADLTYQTSLNRMWSRATRFDFYWPALAHIGEQAILGKEIFADGTANDETVFGYQERYAEYRYRPSQITGVFRSNATASLDFWHLSQDFENLPTLDDLFIQDNPPIDRIVAVPSEPDFLFDAYMHLRCTRPMPMYGVPGMIDHF